MKKKCLYAKLNDQKGAAAVITLCVLLVLTVLGTMALSISTISVTMGGKTVRWSDEYYTMDCLAEKYVNQIDEKLADAEKDARIYVQNRMDKIAPGNLESYMASESISFSIDYDMHNAAQEFFYNYYLFDWTDVGLNEYTLDDYQCHYIDGSLSTISKAYATAAATYNTPEAAFEADLTTYISQLFDRVYFHMLSLQLLIYTDGADTLTGPAVSMQSTKNVVLKGGSANYGVREPNINLRCTKAYASINYSTESEMITDWNDRLNPANNSIGLYIRISGGTSEDMKQVRVEVDVTSPEYKTITKNIYTPLLGNPILTNALSAQGSVTFNSYSNAKIFGDLYSSGEGGISVKGNANVNIRGNVYTPGDFKVDGSNGSVTVDTILTNASNAIAYDYKNKTYGNAFFYDNLVNKTIDVNLYAPDAIGVDYIPLVFRDYLDQGNVYCDSVYIGNETNPISGSSINIRGNLWTKDDIQLDANDSTIRIGYIDAGNPKYNYIGLSQESEYHPTLGEIDHRASSSVINNYPFHPSNLPSSEIVLNSNFIVPGVAFYEFDEFYMSVESVTSRTSNPISILNAYWNEAGDIYQTYTTSEGEQFDLVTEVDLEEKRKRMIKFVDTHPYLETNIRTDLNANNIAGYIAGIALIDTNDVGSKAEIFANHTSLTDPQKGSSKELIEATNNYIAHSNLYVDNFFKNVFYSKTKKLGTTGPGSVDDDTMAPFSHFFDSSITNPGTYFNGYEIKVIANGGTLDVNAVPEGIVFCNGNLTISNSSLGEKEFRGTIICTGNVNIIGKVKLVYDESIIIEKMKNYYNVRQFFQNIYAATNYFDANTIEELDIASVGGERNVVKRLKIKSWRELSVTA
jgi:hypothetical protein